MIDLSVELLDVVRRNAQLRGRQIAMNRHKAGGTVAAVSAQRFHLADAFLTDQKIKRAAFSRPELFDQKFADEAGGSSDEIVHYGVYLTTLNSCPINTAHWSAITRALAIRNGACRVAAYPLLEANT